MANKKISELTSLATVAGTEQIEVNDSGTSKRTLISTIKTYLLGFFYTETEVDNLLSAKQDTSSAFDGAYSSLTGAPTIPDALADLSADATHRLVTDTEKSTWNAKSDFSGSYTDLTDKPTIPDELADLSADATHRLVTDTEKSTWNAKIDAADVTYGRLDTNGDVGTGAGQLAIGNHTHSGVYEPVLGFTPVDEDDVGAASGVCELNASTKVPLARLYAPDIQSSSDSAATDPTTRSDGGTLVDGDIYIVASE